MSSFPLSPLYGFHLFFMICGLLGQRILMTMPWLIPIRYVKCCQLTEVRTNSKYSGTDVWSRSGQWFSLVVWSSKQIRCFPLTPQPIWSLITCTAIQTTLMHNIHRPFRFTGEVRWTSTGKNKSAGRQKASGIHFWNNQWGQIRWKHQCPSRNSTMRLCNLCNIYNRPRREIVSLNNCKESRQVPIWMIVLAFSPSCVCLYPTRCGKSGFIPLWLTMLAQNVDADRHLTEIDFSDRRRCYIGYQPCKLVTGLLPTFDWWKRLLQSRLLDLASLFVHANRLNIELLSCYKVIRT